METFDIESPVHSPNSDHIETLQIQPDGKLMQIATKSQKN